MILLLDGTSDSRKLGSELVSDGYSIIATATTEEGAEKLKKENIQAIQGKLDYETIISKCRELYINAIIDGSHPYADAMHENAINASIKLGIPLIRFEREMVKIKSNRIIYADNYEKAVALAGKIGKNIFVTTGVRNIANYKGLLESHNVYFRVLPDPDGIKALIDMGVRRASIVAMEGNFTESLDRAIMEYYGIDTVITKDSGFNAEPKILAALSLGINIIIISRKNYSWENTGHTTLEITKILNHYGIK
ncbi:precorrin-6x reductase [Ferroplasma acidiphilum]|uniref:Precorrin-6x reductase n=1 Tax=Ferroplasma acidiphilum TaxID=74969 RepID=A0A1V0N4T3_9ARCH|nr:precorrin-6A reductase [Ferroplasma acidiphilum]ARD85150.1 precorrin-6x reductase [Ferroplasma acidiphilum]WMT54093.1 MAG: precorrin-6A reductase [Ferroplasma acidiphilum]